MKIEPKDMATTPTNNEAIAIVVLLDSFIRGETNIKQENL
jgi:hypothetical protein